MNKKAFLEFLEKKLFYLVESARQEELNKYQTVIDNYINMGQSEETVISSLGNPDDLVKAIYLSHGLDYGKLFDNKVSGKGIKNAFKNFYLSISGSDKKKAKNAILYFLYIILIIVLLKVVFIFVRDEASVFFSDLFADKTISKIYSLSLEVLYVFAAIFVFFKMFTKKFN